MTPASIHLSTIARFSHDGRVFRSFGRLIAARTGELLTVPFGLATGDFSAVRDGCPVPWGEVLAAVETPVNPGAGPIPPEQLAKVAPLVAALFPPYGWVQDSFPISDGASPVRRVSSPDGVIYCWVR